MFGISSIKEIPFSEIAKEFHPQARLGALKNAYSAFGTINTTEDGSTAVEAKNLQEKVKDHALPVIGSALYFLGIASVAGITLYKIAPLAVKGCHFATAKAVPAVQSAYGWVAPKAIGYSSYAYTKTASVFSFGWAKITTGSSIACTKMATIASAFFAKAGAAGSYISNSWIASSYNQAATKTAAILANHATIGKAVLGLTGLAGLAGLAEFARRNISSKTPAAAI